MLICQYYSLIRHDRKSRSGVGGVCAYIKSQIPFKTPNCVQDVRFETLWPLPETAQIIPRFLMFGCLRGLPFTIQ